MREMLLDASVPRRRRGNKKRHADDRTEIIHSFSDDYADDVQHTRAEGVPWNRPYNVQGELTGTF